MQDQKTIGRTKALPMLPWAAIMPLAFMLTATALLMLIHQGLA